MNNAGVIFKRALRDSRNGVLGWGIGLGLTMMATATLYPTLSTLEAFLEILEMPIYQAFIGEAADAAFFATPEGFIAVYGLTFQPVILAVYLVILGMGISAGEEERGTIDLLLSTPTPRWQLIAEKFLALIVIITLVLILQEIGLLVGVLITPDMELSAGRLTEATIAMVPIMLVIAAMSLFFSTLLRSRMKAGGITGAIVIASYLITNLSTIATEALGTVKYFSFFTYYMPMQIMQQGIVWPEFLVMSMLAVILFGLSLVAFQRRDLNI